MVAVDLLDSVRMEKMLLAKRVGTFLATDQADEERAAVENVARVLAQDVCEHVRSVLAFELRKCRSLPHDIIESIACDIESVAGPFLEKSCAFRRNDLIRLIPKLEEYARVIIAQRGDLSHLVALSIASTGEEPSVSSLVRNDRLKLKEPTCDKVIQRFGENQVIMDQLGGRTDLPLSVVEVIASRVSEHCRATLIEHYAVAAEVASEVAKGSKMEVLVQNLMKSSPAQIHAYVTELRTNRRLNHLLVLEIAEKGCLPFMESALALEAGLPISRIREILTLEDPTAFVRLMDLASVSKILAPKYLRLAKRFFGPSAAGQDNVAEEAHADNQMVA